MAGRGIAGAPGSTTARSAFRADDESASEVTTIIPIDDSDLFASWDNDSWPGEQQTRRRTSTSEITQDIVIPEGEFDRYSHEQPFDVDGAHFDDYDQDDDNQDGTWADRGQASPAAPAFRRNTAGQTTRTRGKHRISAPPKALRGGRAALIAVAAGAAVAAVAQISATDDPTPTTATTNAASATETGAAAADQGPGIAPATANQDTSMYSDQLAAGKQLAADEAARIAAANKPLYASPIDFSNPACQFTSLYAMRWGSMHGGIDLACPLGTPIHAVTDGVIVNAGPASGYGNWVQLRADDGTITMYGHMAASGVLVQKGQHVTAGQTIALVGNEGFSTGPHLHIEVWKHGVTKIDPVPWLAAHGIRLPAYHG